MAVIREVLSKKYPELFLETNVTSQDPLVTLKFSLVESFIFLHEIMTFFLPNMTNPIDGITETHARIPHGSLAQDAGAFLLKYIGYLEHAVISLPNGEPMKGLDVFFMQSLIHRAMGNRAESVDAARKSLEYSFKRVNLTDMAPVFRVIIPLFQDAACLLENDLVEEADEVLPHIARFSSLYSQAKQCLDVLAKLKEEALERRMRIDQPPEHQYQFLQEQLLQDQMYLQEQTYPNPHQQHQLEQHLLQQQQQELQQQEFPMVFAETLAYLPSSMPSSFGTEAAFEDEMLPVKDPSLVTFLPASPSDMYFDPSESDAFLESLVGREDETNAGTNPSFSEGFV